MATKLRYDIVFYYFYSCMGSSSSILGIYFKFVAYWSFFIQLTSSHKLNALLPEPVCSVAFSFMHGQCAAICAHNSSKMQGSARTQILPGVALEILLSAATILPCCFVSYAGTAPTADSCISRQRERCWWDCYLSVLVGTNAEIGENWYIRQSEITFREVEYFTVL